MLHYTYVSDLSSIPERHERQRHAHRMFFQGRPKVPLFFLLGLRAGSCTQASAMSYSGHVYCFPQLMMPNSLVQSPLRPAIQENAASGAGAGAPGAAILGIWANLVGQRCCREHRKLLCCCRCCGCFGICKVYWRERNGKNNTQAVS